MERRLLGYAAVFLVGVALALTLSPAARLRSWQVDYRWQHWLGVLVWGMALALAHRTLNRHLPWRDPYLLPLAGLLSGWGLMLIWRLRPSLGVRQTIWLALGALVIAIGARFPQSLGYLRRYKYLWLSSALVLTALTLLFGVNPQGDGPPMWLGLGGFYLQPSEPLKLLLVVYLAAYMADRQPLLVLNGEGKQARWRLLWSHWLPLIGPTVLMVALALILLLLQRDLGTAAIFFLLYAAIVYLASGERSVLAFSALGLGFAALLGYGRFEVVRVRIDSWWNPWLDPSGRSYQVVQALMAIANGGLLGRGPGMGSPALVPLAHSDLVFAALAEEFGLVGVVALLGAYALLAERGLRLALQATSLYRRLLAAGLTTLLVGQALLIIAGSLRLLPLTGVTLPFLAYGGSSLLTSFGALLLLLLCSPQPAQPPARLYRPRPYLEMAGFLFSALLACALASGWWALPRAEALLGRTDNQRRAIAERYVPRGALLDRNLRPISLSSGLPGAIQRQVLYPPLSNVVGYTNPTYGQAALEKQLDDYLRGLRGNPALTIWLNHLLYGMPPPGLDVRLTLDLEWQRRVDDLLGARRGAVVVLNAQNGEILVMASHPTFDANRLEEQWVKLVQDKSAPLVNRAVQGRYPIGALQAMLNPLELGAAPLPANRLLPPTHPQEFQPSPLDARESNQFSPLQMALAAAALTNQGVRPPVEMVSAVHTPQGGWVPLPPLADAVRVLSAYEALARCQSFADEQGMTWLVVQAILAEGEENGAWAVGGTLPAWQGTPFALALFLEGENAAQAETLGRALLQMFLGGQSPAQTQSAKRLNGLGR